MSLKLIAVSILTLCAGLMIQLFNLKIATHFGFLDIPTARRRHPSPTPITGGVGVILTWCAGFLIYEFANPQWVSQHLFSFLLILGCSLILVTLGLIDDLKGLTPRWKLATEFVVAGITLTYLPEVRDLCEAWSTTLDPFGFMIWPVALIWIVGITNSINLIDGLDGLAGGFSVLALSSIVFLCLLLKEQTEFPLVICALLIPSVLAFLRFNWSNAKMFLGDNGSLPLGYLISTCSLMCRPHSKSWVMIASIILMLGYPLLDMGLAVLRRFIKGQPLFKADRNHLHYKIQRLGLTKTQTAALLLSIGLYFQLSALCLNLISPSAAALALVAVSCSTLILLQLVRSIETSRIKRIFEKLRVQNRESHLEGVTCVQAVVYIELAPFLEVAMLEEKARYSQLMDALTLMLRSVIQPEEALILKDQRISIILHQELTPDEDKIIEQIREKFSKKIHEFLELYEVQCSLASIPIRVEKFISIRTNPRRRLDKFKTTARRNKIA